MVSFGIIDDDPVCRRMLESIIEESNLGIIVTNSPGGADVIEDILDSNPQVVLIDLLMPDIDGITLISELKKAGYTGNFIMISQIDNKSMVEEAYKQGIEFFIHKPINRFEVKTVIENVKDKFKLNRSLDEIRESLSNLGVFNSQSQSPHQLEKSDPDSVRHIAQQIIMDIGLLGESGSNDILIAMEILVEKNYSINDFPSLKELYKMIALHDGQSKSEKELNRDLKAMEQRIRRAVLAALTNLASIGLTDYAHPKFEYYAPLLFDFQDVRLKMNELENESAINKVKINVKKFLQVLYIETLEKLKAK